MTKNQIQDYLQFKAAQFFRLRGIKIPKESKLQQKLLATIPQEIKKQWAMEIAYLIA